MWGTIILVMLLVFVVVAYWPQMKDWYKTKFKNKLPDDVEEFWRKFEDSEK